MKYLLPKVLTLFIFLAATTDFSSNAQFSRFSNPLSLYNSYQNAVSKGKSLKGYMGYSIGIGKAFSSARFEHSFLNTNSNGIVKDGEIRKDFSVSGLNVFSNIYYPLTSIDENSVLAFNFGVTVYAFNYQIGEINPSENVIYDYDLTSLQIGLPLTLDYKYGGEGVYDKSQRVSYTLGVGVVPILYGTNFGQASKISGGFRPYIHTEIGFFALIEWKIRASCLLGNARILKLTNEDYGMNIMPAESFITMDSKPVFSIGIALMPFSRAWESYYW